MPDSTVESRQLAVVADGQPEQICVQTVDLASKVAGCGNTSVRVVDGFQVFQLTPAATSW
jgi:hypothetical protein